MLDREQFANRNLKIFDSVIIAGFGIALIVSVFKMPVSDIDIVRLSALTAIVAFMEIFSVKMPWARPLRAGVAPAVAIILIRPLPEALWVFLVGALVGRAVSNIKKQSPRSFFHIAQRGISFALAGLIYHLLIDFRAADSILFSFPWDGAHPFYNPATEFRALAFPIAFVAFAAVFFIIENILSAFEANITSSGRISDLFIHQAARSAPIYLVMLSSGCLIALFYYRIQFLAFAVFVIPLLIAAILSNHDYWLDQNFYGLIAAYADSMEMARGEQPGHARRVANLCEEIGQEMSMPFDEIYRLKRAALLHDMNISAVGDGIEDNREAEIADSIPMLSELSGVLRVYRNPPVFERGERSIRTPIEARLLKVASDFDTLSHPSMRGNDPAETVDAMLLNRGNEYDSSVLRALQVIVTRKRRARLEHIEKEQKKLSIAEIEEGFDQIFDEDEKPEQH